MFHNFTSVIGTVVVITVGAISPSATSEPPARFATTYLNGQGQRLTPGFNGAEWSAPTGHPATKRMLDIAIQNNVCISLMMTKRLKSAKESCERALHLGTAELQHPEPNESHASSLAVLAVLSSNLGVVNALLGKEPMASASFDGAIQLDPEYEAARHNLAVLRARRGFPRSTATAQAATRLPRHCNLPILY